MSLRIPFRYGKGKRLSGIIYMHRISDVRMGGVSTRNFLMFRNLCGTDAIKNVVLVTSMWGEVSSKVGAEREAELKSDDLFFKPALSEGARIERYEGSRESARRILQSFKSCEPTRLLIQKEIVDERKNVAETSAGMELRRELLEQTSRHKKQLEELVDEMSEAARVHDEHTRKEVEGERQKVLNEIVRLEAEHRKFTVLVGGSPDELVKINENYRK